MGLAKEASAREKIVASVVLALVFTLARRPERAQSIASILLR